MDCHETLTPNQQMATLKKNILGMNKIILLLNQIKRHTNWDSNINITLYFDLKGTDVNKAHSYPLSKIVLMVFGAIRFERMHSTIFYVFYWLTKVEYLVRLCLFFVSVSGNISGFVWLIYIMVISLSILVRHFIWQIKRYKVKGTK